jgi:SAM-dependent methyltransferase
MRDKKQKFEYGFYHDCLKECFQKFGPIEKLPIINNPYKKIKEIYSGGKVLDIGAGKDKSIKKCLNLRDDLYFSLDNDPCGQFDYNSVEEIPENELFSLITANQFFEHITVEDSINLVCDLARHLKDNGRFISTVPNIQHPIRQQSNITHITGWDYKALYMLYKYANLKVIEIARYSKRHPQGIIERILAKYINRIYRIDWCDSILIVGKNSL